jgi:hypothetical protein
MLAADATYQRGGLMLAEIGRRADFALTRATDVVHEGAHATVLHLRRIVGALSVAVVRVKREAEDLVWDYQDVAGDLRRSDGTGTDLPDVGVVDLRHVNGSTDVKKV